MNCHRIQEISKRKGKTQSERTQTPSLLFLSHRMNTFKLCIVRGYVNRLVEEFSHTKKRREKIRENRLVEGKGWKILSPNGKRYSNTTKRVYFAFSPQIQKNPQASSSNSHTSEMINQTRTRLLLWPYALDLLLPTPGHHQLLLGNWIQLLVLKVWIMSPFLSFVPLFELEQLIRRYSKQ